MKANEKQPAVNMVIAEVTDVQQVTTRTKGKVAEWETQEVIWKKSTEWIKKDNGNNVVEIEDQNAQPEEVVKHTEGNPTWMALQECQIVLPLACLLQLVLRFTADLQATLIKPKPARALAFFSYPKEGPVVEDTSIPAKRSLERLLTKDQG